jgi:hypothetical protein
MPFAKERGSAWTSIQFAGWANRAGVGKPEESMATWCFATGCGAATFRGQTAAADAIQDVAVLAFPSPADGPNTAAARREITRNPPPSPSRCPIALARMVHPARAINVTAELQASDDRNVFRTVEFTSIGTMWL